MAEWLTGIKNMARLASLLYDGNYLVLNIYILFSYSGLNTTFKCDLCVLLMVYVALFGFRSYPRRTVACTV